MVTQSTILLTMDNSGAKQVKCIKIYKKPGRGHGIIGDMLQVLIISIRNRGFIRVKKGEINYAVLSRTSINIFRSTKGYFFKFDKSACVLLSKKKLPIGTRIFGPCSKELRKKNNSTSRILSLSSKIL